MDNNCPYAGRCAVITQPRLRPFVMLGVCDLLAGYTDDQLRDFWASVGKPIVQTIEQPEGEEPRPSDQDRLVIPQASPAPQKKPHVCEIPLSPTNPGEYGLTPLPQVAHELGVRLTEFRKWAKPEHDRAIRINRHLYLDAEQIEAARKEFCEQNNE